MANMLTVGELSPANLAAYSSVIYFDNVTHSVVRNMSNDVGAWDLGKVAACSTWTNEQWGNFSFVYPICGDLQPNADIAGVGVIIAFVATALITVIGCIFKSICMVTLQPEHNMLRRLVVKKDNRPRFTWWTQHRAEFWNHVCGKLIIGLADQQMVTGFAILVSGLHTYNRISAYHFYIVVHVAAFATVTQSMAILVIFDMVHKSLVLHSIRVLVYSTTLFIFYYSAWYSYDLTGSEGFRASCPASCQFKHYSNNWIVVVAAGSPIYLFIITDLFRKILETRGLINPKTWIQEKPMSELTVFQKFKSIFFQHGFQVARFLVWGLCLVDLCVACFGVFSSWFIWRYDGLVLSPDFDDISWGFGQLVAVILICLPVLTMAEEWKDKAHEERIRSSAPNSYNQRSEKYNSGGEFSKLPTANNISTSFLPGSNMPRTAQRYGSTYKISEPTITDLGNGTQTPRSPPKKESTRYSISTGRGYGPLEQNPYSPPLPTSAISQIQNQAQPRPQYQSQASYLSSPSPAETLENRYTIPDIISYCSDTEASYGFPSASSFPLQTPTPYIANPYDHFLNTTTSVSSIPSINSSHVLEKDQLPEDVPQQASRDSLREEEEEEMGGEQRGLIQLNRLSFGPLLKSGTEQGGFRRKPVGGGRSSS